MTVPPRFGCNCGKGCPCLGEAEHDRDDALDLLRQCFASFAAHDGAGDFRPQHLANAIRERFPELAR